MYLKNIEVQGFKSFAQKINFEFHNGITGIVGPNGSGKSNVGDAVRWVLGEQSARSLRGGNMQDVIFSGTETRKPLGYASVAITLDNSDHKLPVDFNEVTVTRRLYRSGESEYKINGSACRLKDINEMFYDTGIGKDEYQCGRGVRCGEETALKIGAAAKQHGIQMSIHAPYFINLSSEESERMEKNVGYVLETARLAVPLGATRMVVHCGGQGKLTRDRAMRNSHENVKNILRALDEAHLTGCAVCLETMGKKSVLGTAEEVCELVAADDRLLPCIDFGHLNCRTGGHMNTREEVKALFDLMENTIGHERTAKLHAHFSHIEYNDKGEVRHLTFADTVYGPDFTPVAEETAVRGYAPTFICESAGTQAEDALAMKQCFMAQAEK